MRLAAILGIKGLGNSVVGSPNYISAILISLMLERGRRGPFQIRLYQIKE
jgi:hypothetical protein